MPILNTIEKSVMNVAGHHHLYHRGQLRDYPTYHIITGGASYDQRWGQGSEQDFDDVQKTIDYWPFQIVELDSEKKSMHVETYIIGNEQETFDKPMLIDEFFRVFGKEKPNKPAIKALPNEPIKLPYTFESSSYSSSSEYDYNSVQFQVSETQDFSDLQFDLIRDYENIYGPHPQGGVLTDLNKDVDIFKIELGETELYDGKHYIRVRHRDRNMEWSEWSDPVEFTTHGGKSGPTTLTMTKTSYELDEEIVFTYTNASGLDKQWVGIYKAGQNPANVYSTAYKYIEGTEGTVSFTLSSPDTYYAAIFKDNGYILLAQTETFTVGNVPIPQISTDKTKYEIGEAIKVSLISAPKYEKDWIGIYKVGDTPGAGTPSTAWEYVSTAVDEVVTIESEKLTEGFYFVTYLLQDAYGEPGERVIIQIGDAAASLATDYEEYEYKEPITFYFENGPGNLADYIAIYKEGAVPEVDDMEDGFFLEGKSFGIETWEQELEPGNYYAQIFFDAGFDPISNKAVFKVKKEIVGIENIELGSIRIYPNPAKTFVTIELSENSPEDTLIFTDITGTVIEKIPVLNRKSITIPLKNYNSGVYFVQANSYSGKLIVL
ncbi:MAG: T9SS type A sorting domain-containing protein [Bacteroidales bacterium]|nr:T9SS type A sorting domain-containing protein [Bacteroidales bacterium]